PRQAIATLRFATASPLGGAVRVTLDGTVVGERTWPPPPPQAKEPPPRPPWELVLPLTAGTHTLTLTNPSGPEWVEFGSLATGLDMPVIAATGRRSDDLIVLWLYHRRGVFSERTDVATASQVLLEDVPAGHWRLTWWNVDAGEAASSHELEHPGGTLAVDTPPIQRFTAAWLQRQ
ncbi:MAG TPA: hypothetical protein VHF69_11460, partial [Candidatus Synoicihabitans sp.]|nr:hypothetical protein [Candidatus Synoicihabitans sp.]